MSNFCPSGFKKVTRFNGLSTCVPCQASKCLECVDMFIRVKDDSVSNSLKSYTTPNMRKDVEICLKCSGGHFLSANKTRCEASNGVNSTRTFFADFVVEPLASFIPVATKAADIAVLRQNEKVGKFNFIQQALSHLNDIAGNYKEVNATIWLTKGDHFFFYCDKKVKYNDTLAGSYYQALKHDVLCSLDSLLLS